MAHNGHEPITEFRWARMCMWLRCDPKRKGLLYAGTETGVYVSFDDGNNWQSLQLNLPIASVRDLAVHDNRSSGGNPWTRVLGARRSVGPLREIANPKSAIRDTQSRDVYLFKPEPAIRIRRSVNTDTPLPPEEPQGKNPPAGAIIDYYFKSTQSGPITLEIYDASGNLVRSYSNKVVHEEDGRPQPVAHYWFPKMEHLGTHAGLNRFVWDLHYFAAPDQDHDYGMNVANLRSVREPQGPLLSAGKYVVKLTVEGRTYSQPLDITMDPRVKVSDAALKQQLRLAIEVWNTISDANSFAGTLDSLDAQLSKVEHTDKLDPQIRTMVFVFCIAYLLSKIL